MGDFFGLFGNDDEKTLKEDTETTEINNQGIENGALHLHQEELDIAKNSANTGEVVLSKEIIEEHKVVEVPVTHEEVVIERRSINNEPSDSAINAEETIRIPVSEEHVEVSKHTVTTGEVSAHKRSVEATQHIDETLKREEARVNTTGSVNVINNENITNTSTGVETNTKTTGISDVADVGDASIAEVSDNNFNGDLTPS